VSEPLALDVVVRCRNEMPWTERTLRALAAQEGVVPRICFIDTESTDGSREAAVRFGAQVHDWEAARYVPGQVLSFGMRETRSPFVAFVNADAVPEATDALARLVAPLSDPSVAATFARQVPRPDADPLTRVDYERAFGEDAVSTRLGAFFSMAASAVRRDVWERVPFDARLRYSEDVDWTTRARALGYDVVYVPDARFEHSHAYDARGHYARRRGEGDADTRIHRLGRASLWRDLARPLAGSLLRDLRAGVVTPRTTFVRAVQGAGYYVGRRGATR
jgi:rhamnosyltransferase